MFPIFEKLGGLESALEIIASHRGGDKRGGERHSPLTLRKWRFEGMSDKVRAVLMDECRARSIPISDDDFKWRSPHGEAAE